MDDTVTQVLFITDNEAWYSCFMLPLQGMQLPLKATKSMHKTRRYEKIVIQGHSGSSISGSLKSN